MTRPRGLVGPVLAMARPRRPEAERDAVRAATDGLEGNPAAVGRALARHVVALALAEIDRDPADRLIALLASPASDYAHTLATCPEIDTGAVIRAERRIRMEERGWRRLPEREWPMEDREVARAACRVLALRYARHLRQAK